MRKKSAAQGERSAALVTTLAVVVLIAGMVASLAVGMRLEQQSSYYYQERQRALLLSGEGTAYGEALLEGVLAANGVGRPWWASGPGFLSFLIVTNGNAASLTTIPLSSGDGQTSQTGIYAPADLNPFDRLDNVRLLDPSSGGTNLLLNWIYVRADGSLDTNQAPADLARNPVPLAGRFAFWIDDESARIDLNTAWGQAGNTNAPGHPSQVNLTALPGLSQAMADALRAAAALRPFNTPSEALSEVPAAASVLTSNRFDLTHAAHDPDMTPWGGPKIVLTTQAANLASNGQPYLNILATTNADPGSLANIDPAALQNTLSNLVSQLSRTNWPYVYPASRPASLNSLAGKYYPAASTNRTWQLALDIVEYVRAKESTNALVEPLCGLAGDFTAAGQAAAATGGAGFFGTGRRPMLSEIAAVLTKLPAAGGVQRYQIALTCGFAVPAGAGIAFPGGLLLNAQVVPSQANAGVISSGLSQSAMVTDKGLSASGDLRFFQAAASALVYTNAPGAPDPTNCFVRVALKDPSDKIVYDAAPLYGGPATAALINLPVSAAAASPPLSAQAADPRVDKRADDWAAAAPLWTSLRAAPNLGATPPQDGETSAASGPLAARCLVPAPKGSSGNPAGLVASVGELGYVATGVQCATNAGLGGVPWRTFRFQATPGATTNTVPDWALCDFLSPPAPIPPGGGSVYAPYPGVVAGRMNLNAQLRPFPGLARTNGIDAALAGTGLPAATLSNLYRGVLAANGVDYGGGGVGRIVSVGQLAEIAGVGDAGESGEDLFRALSARPLTTRGDVFTIYVVGQALKPTAGGGPGLLVTGQKRTRTTLERYPTNTVSGTGTTNAVSRFRVLQARED